MFLFNISKFISSQKKQNKKDYSDCTPLFIADKIVTTQGQTLYIGIEEIDKEHAKFWEDYRHRSKDFSDQIIQITACYIKDINDIQKQINDAIKNNDNSVDIKKLEQDLDSSLGYLKELLTELDLFKQDEDYDRLINKFKVMGSDKINQLAQNIRGGMEGLGFATSRVSKEGRKIYVAYISNSEIVSPMYSKEINEENLKSEDPSKCNKAFVDNYNDIVASVGLITEPFSDNLTLKESYTPIGICKNPLYFLVDVAKYQGISMILHGFIASKFQEKGCKTMSTSPMKSMSNILEKKLGKDNITIFDSTNKESNNFNHVVCSGIPTVVVNTDALCKYYESQIEETDTRQNKLK